jgi:hypothetical protein
MTDRQLMAQFDGPSDHADPFAAIEQAADEALWRDSMATLFGELDTVHLGPDPARAR